MRYYARVGPRGVEPRPAPYQRAVLTAWTRGRKCGRRDSNPHSRSFEPPRYASSRHTRNVLPKCHGKVAGGSAVTSWIASCISSGDRARCLQRWWSPGYVDHPARLGAPTEPSLGPASGRPAPPPRMLPRLESNQWGPDSESGWVASNPLGINLLRAPQRTRTSGPLLFTQVLFRLS